MVTTNNDLKKRIENIDSLCIKNDSLCDKTNISKSNNIKDEKVKKKKKKKKKKRCTNCNKKLGLIPFGCKCGNEFCSKCRYTDTHNCTYDWKTEAREKIEKDNPQIIFKKVEDID